MRQNLRDYTDDLLTDNIMKVIQYKTQYVASLPATMKITIKSMTTEEKNTLNWWV